MAWPGEKELVDETGAPLPLGPADPTGSIRIATWLQSQLGAVGPAVTTGLMPLVTEPGIAEPITPPEQPQEVNFLNPGNVDVNRKTPGPPASTAPAPRPPIDWRQLLEDADLPQTVEHQTSSWSSTSPALPPAKAAEFQGRLGETRKAESEAIDRGTAIAQSSLRDQASIMRGLAAGEKERHAELIEQQAGIEKLVATQQGENARILEDIKNTHIDPERIYAGGSGAVRRIGAALATALGTLGAGLARMPNFAAQIVREQVDDDVKRQMHELQNKHYAYQAGRNVVTDLYAKTRDLERSYLLAHQVYADIAKAQIDSMSRDAQSQQAIPNAERLKAQLERVGVDADSKLTQLATKRVTSGGSRVTGELSPFMKAAGLADIQSHAQALGAGGKVADNTPQKDISRGIAAAQALRGLGRIRKAIDIYDPNNLPGWASKEATRLYQAELKPVISAHILAMSGQAMTEQEYERRRQEFPLGKDITGLGIRGERSRREQEAKLKALESQNYDVLRSILPGSPKLQNIIKTANPDLYQKVMGMP